MGTYGRQVQETTGRPFAVSADGRPEWKHIGITLDWSTVDAVSEETTLDDGTVVANGDKYLPAGTILDVITASGAYGPADTAADDGRQTLARGETYILNQSVVLSSLGSDHPPVLEGGLVFADRLQDGETVAGATQPAITAVLTAMPRLRLVNESE